MSVEFRCADPAALAGYLYNECDPAERASIEAHLAMCVACAEELEGLRMTRTALSSWAPPDARLGFRITSGSDEDAARVLRPGRWWQRPMPAWAQAAAAVLVFAAGAGIGMRTGSQAPPSAPRAASAVAPVSAQDLADLEKRLVAQMTAVRASAERPPSAAAAPAVAADSDAAVLQRVRALLAESEERQQRELALRMTQLMRDVDVQRRMDLTRIEQTFGQMEGYTRPELADQRQMLNYLIQRTGMTRAPQ